MVSLLGGASARATDAVWVNNGNLDFPPQIDATNVINNGVMDFWQYGFGQTVPFTTDNTLHYTNNGTMNGWGWRFSYKPTSGQRTLSDSFFNGVNKTISVSDPLGLQPHELSVAATNIVSRGMLSIGSNGKILLVGKNVDLSRSQLQVDPLPPESSQNIDTNFFPATGISDRWWGQTNMTMDTSELLSFQDTNLLVIVPPHNVDLGGGFIFPMEWGLLNPLSFVFTNDPEGISVTITNEDASETNIFVPTNIVRQVAFVGLADTNFGASVLFSESSDPRNPLHTVELNISTTTTNAANSLPVTRNITFRDFLGSDLGARGLVQNLNTLTTYRPACYELDTSGIIFGDGPNGVLTTNLVYDEEMVTKVVTNEYAGYAAFVENQPLPPDSPLASVTNLPGRVVVAAGSLDLSNVRIRGGGLVALQTDHLLSSAGAVIDCENMSFSIGSTNGDLVVENVTKESVDRVRGQIAAWSGLWTNQLVITLTNYPDAGGTNDNEPVLVTNTANVRIHVLAFDGTGLQATIPVGVQAFQANSTNIVVKDSMLVSDTLQFNGERLTLEGRVTHTEPNSSFASSNAPTLLYFTNRGILNIPNQIVLGPDRVDRYEAIVNYGTNNSAGQTYQSAYFQNSGVLNASSSGVEIQADSAKLENGTVSVAGDFSFAGNTLRMRNHTVQTTSGALYLNVTNVLADAGPSAPNGFVVQNGFHLPVKPEFGDLFGTKIETIASTGTQVVNDWAGEDRGPVSAGFENNVVIGHLLLSAGAGAVLDLRGTGETNGLYVDYLELNNTLINNLESALRIDPNLTLYFANANVRADELDGRLGGRLRWVRSFAGPNSSIEVVQPDGSTIVVNEGLRWSTQVDSDADGVPNAFDLYPFDGVTILSVSVNTNSEPSSVDITWRGAAQTVYGVEFSTSIAQPNWELLLNYINTNTVNGNLTVPDTNAVAGERYYRVFYTP